jgi:hypothetical protein
LTGALASTENPLYVAIAPGELSLFDKLANSWSSWLICCSISCNYSRTSYATGGRWFELCAGAERILQLRMRGTQLLNWHGTPMLSFASRAKPIGIF